MLYMVCQIGSFKKILIYPYFKHIMVFKNSGAETLDLVDGSF